MPLGLERVPAGRLSAARLYAFLDPLYGFAAPRPAEDIPSPAVGFAALEADELLGLATLELLPSLQPGESLGLLQVAVAPERRRQGLATALLRDVLAEARKRAPRLQLLALPPAGSTVGSTVGGTVGDGPAIAFLGRHGFTELSPLVHYRGPLAAPPAETGARFRVQPYRGGETGVDAAILERYRRAFGRQPATPEIAPAELAGRFADPAFGCLLLLDDGRPVGDVQFLLGRDLCFVQSFALDRSHWGSGAADLLVRELIRFAVAQGCAELAALVVESNRASTALIRRAAPLLRPLATTRRFARPLGETPLYDGDPLAA